MEEAEKKCLWPGWETVRLIGRGSFGAVYEIQRNVLGETERAALKVITIPQNSTDIEEMYSDGYDGASITAAFQAHLKAIVAEYSLMRKLNGNTNVVNCDDVRYVQHEDGIGWDIFIKMELLMPLSRTIGQTVPDEQVIHIGADICKALVLCRRHDIIHRDIKPANIFVSEDGDYKLGDFGIAKTVEKTSGGTKIGTYEYMAPEVYIDRPYGSAADIYSLGMVLYWLLNEHRTPFLPLPPTMPTSAEKEQARRRRFAGEPLPAPAHGSEELKRIVLKACAFDPKDRYRTAGEMLADLTALQSGSRPTQSSSQPAQGGSQLTQGDGQPTQNVSQPVQNDWKPVQSAPQQSTQQRWQIDETDEDEETERAESTVSDDRTIGVFGEKPVPAEPPKEPGRKKHGKLLLLAAIAAVLVLCVGLGLFGYTHCWFGHVWEQDATCTAPRTCTRCSATEGEALGHDWADAACETPKTCIRCGATEGEALGHNWVDAACETPKTCTRCGATEGEALGHDWVDAACETPKTCTRCGATEGEALGHDWVDAACETPKTCTRCSKTEGTALGHDWKDATIFSPKTCTRCGMTEGESLAGTLKAGDVISFGHYEQDNDAFNGREEIEWQVLDKKDGKVLVISKYALDCQPYNEEYESVTWETCTLRSWLNSDFYHAAFSEDEKKAIMQTTVTADKNPEHDTNPGSSTKDSVFLLSITEAKKYFSDADARMCAPAAYAIAQGAWTSDSYKTASGEATCWWWLRSPGNYRRGAAFVNYGGAVSCSGDYVSNVSVGVRPALWINLGQ